MGPDSSGNRLITGTQFRAQMLSVKLKSCSAFYQHHIDFKPREFSWKGHALQSQTRKHEFLMKGEILQQQLVIAKTAVPPSALICHHHQTPVR